MNNFAVMLDGLNSHGFQPMEKGFNPWKRVHPMKYVSPKIYAALASDCSGNPVRGPLPSSVLERKAQFTKQYCIA